MSQNRSMNFTDSNVDGLVPEARKYDVRDRGGRGSIPGLLVRVEGSGTKTFYFRYTFNGKVKWFRIGVTAMRVEAARLMAREMIGDVARGRDPQAERAANRGGLTFAQLQRRHLEEHAKLRNKRWQQPDYLLRKYVLPQWASLRATEIKRAQVKALFGQLSVDTPALANQVKAAISAVFKFGVDEEVVADNPCKGVKDNPTNSRERVLSASEVALFWAACDQINPVKAAALKTVLLTAQRPGEVIHMRREHVRDGWWSMPGEPQQGWPGTKNSMGHRVWLSARVRETMGELPRTAGFVFADERGKAFRVLHDAMREISAICEFDPPVTPHDLRRTAGTTITGRGHGRDAMDRILNHRKKGVTDVYDRHDYAEADKRIMEDIALAFADAVEGREADNVVAFGKAK